MLTFVPRSALCPSSQLYRMNGSNAERCGPRTPQERWHLGSSLAKPIRASMVLAYQSVTDPSNASYTSRLVQSWSILSATASSSISIPRPGFVGSST